MSHIVGKVLTTGPVDSAGTVNVSVHVFAPPFIVAFIVIFKSIGWALFIDREPLKCQPAPGPFD